MKTMWRKALLSAACALVLVLLTATPVRAELDVAGWRFADLTSHVFPLTWQPAFDSQRVAWVKVDNGQSDVYVLDVAGGAETRITVTPETEFAVALDRSRLVWVARQGPDGSSVAQVWLHDLDKGTGRPVAQSRIAPNDSLQVAGDHIAWSAPAPLPGGDPAGQRALYLHSIGSGTTVLVTGNLAAGGNEFAGQTVFDLSETHLAFVEAGASGGPAGVQLRDLATGDQMELGLSTALPRHVSLTGNLVTWAAPAATDPVAPPHEAAQILVHSISAVTTQQVATISTPQPCPKTDGRFVVWDTYEQVPAGEFRVIDGYDAESGQLIHVSQDRFLNSTPEIADGVVVWQRGGELDTEIMACDLDSGAITQLSLNHTWMDQAAQVREGTVVWWKCLFSMQSAPRIGDRFMVAAAPATQAHSFADVSGSDPFRTAMVGLDEQGVANGYRVGSDRLFRPLDPCLRAQFAKMVCEALDATVSEDLAAPFGDLGPDDPLDLYPHEYVAALAAAGVVQGTTAASFESYGPLTRAQAASILVRALDVFRPGVLRDLGWQAPGTGPWSPPHGANLRKAYANDVLAGAIAYLQPWDADCRCPRGEAAQFIWNALALITQEGPYEWPPD